MQVINYSNFMGMEIMKYVMVQFLITTKRLTVFLFQAVKFDFVSFVLRFFLETAGPGGQLVLLLAGFGPHSHGKFTNGRHVVDQPVQFVQFSPDVV